MQVHEARAVLEEAVKVLNEALEREERGDHGDLLDRMQLHRDGLAHWPKIAEALQTLRYCTISQITAPGPRGWGWTQAALARQLGIHPSRISQLLRDHAPDEDDYGGDYPPDRDDDHYPPDRDDGGSVNEWDQPLPLAAS